MAEAAAADDELTTPMEMHKDQKKEAKFFRNFPFVLLMLLEDLFYGFLVLLACGVLWLISLHNSKNQPLLAHSSSHSVGVSSSSPSILQSQKFCSSCNCSCPRQSSKSSSSKPSKMKASKSAKSSSSSTKGTKSSSSSTKGTKSSSSTKGTKNSSSSTNTPKLQPRFSMMSGAELWEYAEDFIQRSKSQMRRESLQAMAQRKTLERGSIF